MHEFDVLPLGQLLARPLTSRHNGTVDRNCTAALACTVGSQQPEDSGALRDIALVTVDDQPHAVVLEAANRCGPNSWTSGSSVPSVIAAVTASAVIGASRMPLR